MDVSKSRPEQYSTVLCVRSTRCYRCAICTIDAQHAQSAVRSFRQSTDAVAGAGRSAGQLLVEPSPEHWKLMIGSRRDMGEEI